MRTAPLICGLLALGAVLGAPRAHAWEPETRMRMVDEAVRFMPYGLRLALERHREPLMRGLLVPLVEENPAARRPPWAGGSLEQSTARAADDLAHVVASSDFDHVAAAFGRLALYVTEAGWPPGMGTDVADARARHFSAFCEDRRPRWPLVFYGHDDPDLAKDSFTDFATRLMERARQEDENLARVYAAAGDPPNPAYFDDRSIPFAIGSLAYSRTVTHLVRAWLTAWENAGGDVGRTPYRDPQEKEPR